MGSRYGGLKQVDPVGPSGEAILDYSVFDALRGGFGKVVFVIRRDFEAEFKEKIGRKFEPLMPVDYCYQDIADLPAPYTVPAGRTKPWGTAHATRAARTVVNEPFAVINADDFYGRDAFAKLAAFLSSEPAADGKMHLAMVGFRLDLTLSENGSVARGICDIAPDGKLRGVTEMTKLVKVGDIAENREDEANPVKVPLDSRVSMNFWGFPAGLFRARGALPEVARRERLEGEERMVHSVRRRRARPRRQGRLLRPSHRLELVRRHVPRRQAACHGVDPCARRCRRISVQSLCIASAVGRSGRLIQGTSNEESHCGRTPRQVP